MTTIPVANRLRIRDCGHDEIWLQDRIATDPQCLGLGELEVIYRERRQSSGGRLDLLLKDPEDDTMYEVELMLGETDETHIVRTIEYWDNEKRKWPQRQHYAVLVAETITRRFFNVIQVMSHAIPIIAIQTGIVEANGQRMLTFSKILDTYQEPEDDTETDEVHDEKYWLDRSSWTIDAANALLKAVSAVFPTASLTYRKVHIGIVVNGNNYFFLHKRRGNKSMLHFRLNERLAQKAGALLDAHGMACTMRKNQSVRMIIDVRAIQENCGLFREIAELVKQSWEE